MIINFKNIKQFIMENSSFVNEENVDSIIFNLKIELLDKGFDLGNLQVLYGETSFNFIKDDIVLRVTFVRYSNYDSLTEYLKNSDNILHPKYEKKIDDTGATILLLDKLDTKNISNDEMMDVCFKLRDDGYLAFDLKKENFGKDKEGNIYLFDYGELIYIKNRPLFLQKLDLESYSIKCPLYDELYKKRKKSRLKRKIGFLKRIKLQLDSIGKNHENGEKSK